MKSETIKYYTVDETCTMLSISRTTLYDLMRTGELRYITIGSVRRIAHAELVRFEGMRRLAA